MSSTTQEPDDLLLVDDHPGEIRLIEEVIESADIETTLYTASEKDEAFELLQECGEQNNNPQSGAILVDWNLTKGTGQEVLRKSKDKLPQTTVAIITSSEHQKEKIKSEAPQADRYFTKPGSPDGYIDIIKSLLV